ncbi:MULTISPECIES: PorP/SprF family type IX secretion system membrane protein [Niastella]|uniref:PorP/SprF family type IX secretion system membrane protein n=1 Tax=Niastella soli TaxID=2821487 RepID=A0ABS3YM32_9BACT|nr:PorP/SprF family type IX secretion system membrane protein [Niastella soli]MBO9198948.1 PorP/SprF family type IX secretion system membrane protein [Niastella soli]
MTTGYNYKRPVAGFILMLSLLNAKGQDIHFSQFFEAPLLRNPSLAGIYTGDYRIQGVYRDQWNSVTNAYRTGSLNAEYKMPIGNSNDFITTGLQAVFDKAGTVGLTTTQILPALNYHKSLSNEKTMYLSLGFMGGYIGKSLDLSKVTTDNQYSGGVYDASLPTGEIMLSPNYSTWDASVGMSFNTTFGPDQQNSMFIGAAYHHLNRPKSSFYHNRSIELNAKYVASIGVKWGVTDLSSITLQADHSIQGGYTETIGGALYSYKLGDTPDDPTYILSGGLLLRWKDALVPVLKIDWGNLSSALSYDVNVSQLKTASMGRGGFEISICYIGFLHRDNSSEYKMLCPKF